MSCFLKCFIFRSLLETILSHKNMFSSKAVIVAVLPSVKHAGPSVLSDHSCPSLTHIAFLQALFPAGKPNQPLMRVESSWKADLLWLLISSSWSRWLIRKSMSRPDVDLLSSPSLYELS